MTLSPFSPSRLRQLLRPVEKLFAGDIRGAISSEYVVLIGTVGLTVAFAIVTVGPRLVKSFEHSRNIIASPFP